MKIPFLDWTVHHQQFEKEWLEDAQQIYRSGVFLQGPFLERFETLFADYCGSDKKKLYATGVANGLDALTLSLRALNLRPGSEILIPGNTFIATALAVVHAGFKPVLVPPNVKDYTIDIESLDNFANANTSAVIPVHLYGRICNMQALRAWAARKAIAIIEDAAQAHGAMFMGEKAGSFGDAAGFSFYPGKNLGALGDAGAVVTPSQDLATTISKLSNYGAIKKYEHETIGTNSRLDEIQAAFLIRKMNFLDKQLAHRRRVAKLLLDELPKELVLPPEDDLVNQSAWHLFVVRHPLRDKLASFLASKEIQCSIHYPKSIDQHNAFLGFNLNPCPVSQCLAKEILSLPIGPHIEEPQIEQVIKQTRSFFGV